MAGKIIDATLRFVDKFTGPMNTAIDKLEKSQKQTMRMGKEIEKTGKKITSAGKAITAGITVPVVAAGAASLKAGIEFESAFAGVKKTVDATDEQLASLKKGILGMSQEIPASAIAISAVAEAAGQLGIETDNILSFTKVMVDLGNSTNLSAEDAATALAKYANVTGMSQKDFDKLGSTIVALGNNFATTESDIVSMATRLSGAGSQIGLTDGEIMGFATALSSVGIEAEMGGSAFSKAMINMQVACETGLGPVEELSKKTGMSLREMQLMSANNSKDFKEMAQSLGYTGNEMNAMIKAGVNLENFADVAGMTSEQFKTAYEKDAAGALQTFIKGLGDTEGKGESTIKMLQDMGFTEVRLRDTLTRLSQSGDGMAKAVEMGNTAWKDNNALTNEANQRYATTESRIEVTKNKLSALGIQVSDILMPKVSVMIDKVSEGITWFNGLNSSTKKTIVNIAKTAAVIGPAIIVIGKLTIGVGKLFQATATITKGLSRAKNAYRAIKPFINVFVLDNIKAKAAVAKQAIALGLNTGKMIAQKAAMIALKGVQLISTGVTTAMTAAQLALNAAFFASPIGWIVLGIGALIAVGILLYKNWDTVKAKATELWGHVKNVFGGVGAWFGNLWDGVKTIFKGFINFLIRGINQIPEALNSINVTVPGWVPGVGGNSIGFNLPSIPYLAKGTKNWKGGLAVTQDAGGEIMDLPQGTRVYPHDQSLKKAYQDGTKTSSGGTYITINKIAERIEVRNEKDIDTIVDKLADRLKRVIDNGGGEGEFA